MQKHEFEQRIEGTVTDAQYKVIEEVYTWHPSVKETSGKEQVAELYKSFGMAIFYDMHHRAMRNRELIDKLRDAENKAERIRMEMEQIRMEMKELSCREKS